VDFKNISYLQNGTVRQRQAYTTLKELNLFEDLSIYKPLLTGTIPIGIDLPESDLDIICHVSNHQAFAGLVTRLYENYAGYSLKQSVHTGMETTVACFRTDSFEVEIFAQNIPTDRQHAYQHMLIEHNILLKKGNDFKAEIIRLKASGMKTEPAFARLLGLPDDPYQALLDYWPPLD